MPTLSVVIPAKNEALALGGVLSRVTATVPEAEVVVVDDGSTDETPSVAAAAGARVVRHKYSMGNGAAIKSGARAATGEIVIFMDADGQHPPEAIPSLLRGIEQGFDMAVGARDRAGQANVGRSIANRFYNSLASWMVDHRIADLTSGFRAVRANKFREFLHLLPNGFSYPTTITMAFFRSAYPVGYVPVDVAQRIGKSHIRPLRDGVRFVIIILRIATLYAPLKLFLPVSASFALLGIGNYAYTWATTGRFTNMSALMLSAAVIVFLIGLISDQITSLTYSRSRG